jgi:eukaryotic-like serine/threonine-protein kinase
MLDARPEDAIKQLRPMREHLRGLPAGHPLASREWDALLGKMQSLQPLPATEARSAAGVIANMLAGLKNWDQGMLEQAAACFNTAASIHLPGDEAWAAIYQNMATAYLHDHRLLSGQLFTVEPADAAACEAAVSLLDETLATLKTRGRGRFNVRAWQLDLKRRAVLLASAAPAPEPAPAAEPEAAAVPNPSPQEVLERLSEFATERRFAEASAWLKKLPQAPQGVSREALLNMTEAAAVFLTDIGRDLAREPFTGELPLEDGGNALRVSVSRDGVITAVLASGGVRTCEWRDFPADSLIAMHRVLVVRNPSGEIERLRRHECAIAFDWLAGNRERALTAAAKLSQGNPLFKKRWDSISAGLPE